MKFLSKNELIKFETLLKNQFYKPSTIVDRLCDLAAYKSVWTRQKHKFYVVQIDKDLFQVWHSSK